MGRGLFLGTAGGGGAPSSYSPDRRRSVWQRAVRFGGTECVCVPGRGWQEDLWRWSVSAVGERSMRDHSRVPENVSVSDWMNAWYGWVLLVLWQELLEEAQNNLF